MFAMDSPLTEEGNRSLRESITAEDLEDEEEAVARRLSYSGGMCCGLCSRQRADDGQEDLLRARLSPVSSGPSSDGDALSDHHNPQYDDSPRLQAAISAEAGLGEMTLTRATTAPPEPEPEPEPQPQSQPQPEPEPEAPQAQLWNAGGSEDEDEDEELFSTAKRTASAISVTSSLGFTVPGTPRDESEERS